MLLNDFINITLLIIAIISICTTIYKSFSELRIEIEKLRGTMNDYVTHKQCSEKRDKCSCMAEIEKILGEKK